MNTEAALRTLARHRRRMAEARMETEFVKLRRRLNRQHTIKLWAYRALETILTVALVGGTVALMLSL